MANPREVLESLWKGGDARARAARLLLSPLELAYGAVTAARSALYDRGVLAAERFSIPVVSVGNLTVGGTGKTPVCAWLTAELRARGASPAIVLRGYGGDETIVHQRLNEGVPVIATSDRVRGIREAIAEGAGVVVMDDAFQHRRAERDVDIVLLNADAWTGNVHLLPAGPWREPLHAAQRADLIIITRKTADREKVNDVREAVSKAAPHVPIASARLSPGDLRSTATGQSLPLHAVEGADLTAIAAIAHPEAFFKQLTELGAVVRPHSFRDHYSFTRRDAERLAVHGKSSDFVVCTLKDAVKLEALWPAEAGSLWYVSQRLRIEDGKQYIDTLLDQLLARPH